MTRSAEHRIAFEPSKNEGSEMDLGIAGRVSVVVGGARGSGYATARDLAVAGAKVVVADIRGPAAQESAARLATETGAETFGAEMDITDLDSVRAGLEKAAERFGNVEILVNAAAIVGDKLFLDSSPDDWRRM